MVLGLEHLEPARLGGGGALRGDGQQGQGVPQAASGVQGDRAHQVRGRSALEHLVQALREQDGDSARSQEAVDHGQERGEEDLREGSGGSVEGQHALPAVARGERDQDAVLEQDGLVVALTLARVLPRLGQGAGVHREHPLGCAADDALRPKLGLVKDRDRRGVEELAGVQSHAHDPVTVVAGAQDQDLPLRTEPHGEAAPVAHLAGCLPEHRAGGAVEGAELPRDHIVDPLAPGRLLVAVHEDRPRLGDPDPVDRGLELAAPAALGGAGHGRRIA